MKVLNDWKLTDGVWYRLYCTGYDDEGEEITEWKREDITVIPVACLVREWEKLVRELFDKECELGNKKEEYNQKEFEIVYMSDIDFKGMYGSTAEKVRKQHAAKELKHLDDEIKSLELSVAWIKQYIPLLKEAVRVKQ